MSLPLQLVQGTARYRLQPFATPRPSLTGFAGCVEYLIRALLQPRRPVLAQKLSAQQIFPPHPFSGQLRIASEQRLPSHQALSRKLARPGCHRRSAPGDGTGGVDGSDTATPEPPFPPNSAVRLGRCCAPRWSKTETVDSPRWIDLNNRPARPSVWRLAGVAGGTRPHARSIKGQAHHCGKLVRRRRRTGGPPAHPIPG